jgi:methylated-DNA-[protein]-cysteine S-methyltransferase
MMFKSQWLMESEIGKIFLVASEMGLQGVFWKQQVVPLTSSLKTSRVEVKILAQAVEELEQYFLGKRKSFSLALEAQGTPFQIRVWSELKSIPYGKTCSYSEIAAKLNHPKAVRAVGTANGKNPLSIFVPCHRVIASNGTLGGYAGGLPIKTHLLHLEKTHTE